MTRPAEALPSLEGCRQLVALNDALSTLHRRGFHWVKRRFLPAARKLEDARAKRHRRTAARAFRRLGDLHDLNGTPRAAVRAYQRALKLEPSHSGTWRSIGCMLDNMGHFAQARHALARAAKLAPDDELLAGDLERVEWAMLNGCPVLFEERNRMWHAAEALAAGKTKRALALVGRRRTVRARQLRARINAVRGDVGGALAEWQAIATAGQDAVQLQHADWYYVLSSEVGDDPALWRLMLWQIRSRLEGGAFHYAPSLAELDISPKKRFELHVRFQLARTEADVTALLALAGKYPHWREPGEAALRLA